MAGNIRKYLKVGITIIVIIIVLGYAYSRSKDLIEGPSINITYPSNGATLSTPLLTITGIALHIAFITLDDRQIFVDENGNLKEQLLLQYGYNIISIKATDRFNRKVEKRLEVTYQ